MANVVPHKNTHPNRISNSFSKEELEVLDVALRRFEEFSNLPGGLVADDYEALSQIVQVALRRGDLVDLIRTRGARSALLKLEGLRRWTQADLAVGPIHGEALVTVMDRVSKMLARARMPDVIQVSAKEAPCG